MKQKIISILQQFGPLLPVEVASKIGIDSFMVKAYLSELVGEGKIKISQEKIAESNIYFLAGQEAQVQQRIFQIGQQSQKTARIYSKSNIDVTPEIQAKRDAFAKRLAEIEEAERKQRAQKTQIQNRSNLPAPQPVAAPPVSFPAISREQASYNHKPEPDIELSKLGAEYAPEAGRDFISRAMDWIRMSNYEIVEELTSKKASVSLVITANSDFGKLNFYVEIKDKKTITKADLVSIYAAAMEQKCPGILITNGQLAKSAQNFLEEKGNIIKVKKL